MSLYNVLRLCIVCRLSGFCIVCLGFVLSVGAVYNLLGLCIVSWCVPTPSMHPYAPLRIRMSKTHSQWKSKSLEPQNYNCIQGCRIGANPIQYTKTAHICKSKITCIFVIFSRSFAICRVCFACLRETCFLEAVDCLSDWTLGLGSCCPCRLPFAPYAIPYVSPQSK